MIKRDNWESRRQEWQVRVMLRDWDNEFGAHYVAYEDYGHARYDIERRWGSLDHPKARAELKVSLDDLQPAEAKWYTNFVKPADDAAIALVRTPAPNEEAVALKAQIILDHELHNNAGIEDDLIEILRSDFQRLGHIPAHSSRKEAA